MKTELINRDFRTDATIKSGIVDTGKHREFSLQVFIESFGMPCTLEYEIWFSKDTVEWFKWKSFIYEDTATKDGWAEELSDLLSARYMYIEVIPNDVDEDNYFHSKIDLELR